MVEPHDLGIWYRVKAAFESVGIETQTDMAKAIGIRQESVSKWAIGKNIPTLRHMIAISKKTGFAVQWLYTEEGPKLVPPGDDERDQVIAILNRLPEERRKEVLRYALYQADAE